VAGLRREEVALLAGMSVDYYTRLERGNLSGVPDNVLESLAGALQLDEAGRAHLYDQGLGIVRACLAGDGRVDGLGGYGAGTVPGDHVGVKPMTTPDRRAYLFIISHCRGCPSAGCAGRVGT